MPAPFNIANEYREGTASEMFYRSCMLCVHVIDLVCCVLVYTLLAKTIYLGVFIFNVFEFGLLLLFLHKFTTSNLHYGKLHLNTKTTLL